MIAKVPVVIVTGYLGSGKTTLLRRLIGSADRRMALLINEFGELAIDSRVVEGKNVRIAELLGGCVCCSLAGEFEAAIAEIIDSAHPDEIVVETTGIAEPDALIGDLENIPGVRLDAAVTVVDADATARFPSIGHTGRIQIETADLILLNKIDLLARERIGPVRQIVREINPSAPIFETIRCEIDPALITGFLPKDRKPHSADRHETTMQSFDLSLDRPLRRECFESAIRRLPSEIYRAKGFVRLEAERFLFNMVAGRQDLEPSGNGPAESEIVFIGEKIKALEQEVRAALEDCRIK